MKSTKSKEAEADDSDESMEDDDEKEEQPRKVMSSPYYLTHYIYFKMELIVVTCLNSWNAVLV